MTWEPTQAEIDAYNWAAVDESAKAEGGDRRRRIVRAGLTAAYAALEERLFGRDPTVLGPPMQIARIPPPLMHYAEANDIDDVNALAAVGWRVFHVYGPRDAPRYVLERERPDPPEPA